MIMCSFDLTNLSWLLRYEGEARPEPEYNEDYQQRKPFVPNNNYRPYARS